MSHIIFAFIAGILVGSTLANFFKWMNSEQGVEGSTVIMGVVLSAWFVWALIMNWSNIQ
jgi:hypothetical protein